MQDVSQPSLSEMGSAVDLHVSTILRCLAPEEIDMLRDAFIYMDRDSDGYVNLAEMLARVEVSVPADRFGPLREYLTPLFLVADKDGDGKLSLTEFLMSFADGPGVVPADVVNSCVAEVRVRLTDEEISTLQENFRAMDVNSDGYLDPEELEGALRTHLQPKFPDLTDSQYKEIVTVVMSSADADRDGKLSLSEFIRSFQEDQGVLPASFVDPNFSDGGSGGTSRPARELTEAEAEVLREAFTVLDTNEDGYIDFMDLHNALWESLGAQVEDKSQITDLCDLIMATADRHKSGRLSLSEFILGFLRNMEVMQIPVAVAQEKVRSACDRLQTMYESGELERLVTVFEDLDHNGDGYIDRAELVNVLISLFKDAFPEWDEATLNTVMSAIVAGAESHSSGRISLEEFIRSFVDGPGILPPEAVRVLSHRATATQAEARPSTASDDDLRRISDALRSLNESADEDGYISVDNLRAGIDAAFADQMESHPGKAEAMFHYVLSRFVNVLDGGRLTWNENVQIEDGNDDGDAAAPCAPTHVPSAQEQERAPSDVGVDAEAADGETHAGESPPNGDTARQAVAEEPKSSSASRHRRAVRVASVEVDPVTRSAGTTSVREVAARAADEDAAAAVQPTGRMADAIASEGTAAGAVCEDFDRACANDAEVYANGMAVTAAQTDAISTVPAVVERANPSALLSMKKSARGLASGTRKPNWVMDSYKYHTHNSSGQDSGSRFEEELRTLFRKYDTEKLGYLDRGQFKKVYCRMEQYGLEPSQAEIDRLFGKYARGSDKIFFDEFCVLMLQRVQM